MTNAVTEIPAAASAEALSRFEAEFAYETDCWDVHEALRSGNPGFVLLDVRGPALYARGHIPGAVNLPHGKIVASRMADYAPDTLFVVHCAGPHCNGGGCAAVRLARLGRPVKRMEGGINSWIAEGFALESAAPAAAVG